MRQVSYTVLISVAVALVLGIGNNELPAKTKESRTSIFWIPGSLAKPSSSVPPTDDNISPKGNGAIITGNGKVHIFIPVNTPVVTENTNVYLANITLVFKTSNGATIQDMWIKRMHFHNTSVCMGITPRQSPANLGQDIK